MSAPAHISSTPVCAFHRGLHRLALTLTAFTWVLVTVGALVISMQAGLSVPDWPTSFGTFRMPAMTGGVLYEHGHRMIAGVVILLTIAFGVAAWKSDRRHSLRMLVLYMFGAVVLQALLGGITVLRFLPPWIVTGHAVLAQTFFGLAVAASVMTSRGWLEAPPHAPSPQTGAHHSLQRLTVCCVAAVGLQLFLGAAFRNGAFGLLPHFLFAWLVSSLLIWTAVRVLSSAPPVVDQHLPVMDLRRPAILILFVLLLQVGLGFGAYITRYAGITGWPRPLMALLTAAHVSNGALLLATTLVLAMRTWRLQS